MKSKLLLSLVVFCLFIACISSQQQYSVPGQFIVSSSSRITPESLSNSGVKQVQKAQTQFAFDLYQTLLKNGNTNLFFSPTSIYSVLGMLYAGANGNTKQQMATTLHASMSTTNFHRGLNSLLQFASLQDLDNEIWIEKTHSFQSSYLDLLANYYGSGLHGMDFMSNAEKSRQDINAWIAQKTQGKIKDLLPPGSVDSGTQLVLSNSVYFKQNWATPFQSLASFAPISFYGLNGKKSTVTMMHLEEYFSYYRGKNYQLIVIPYQQEATMLLWVADVDQFESFQKDFSAQEMQNALEHLEGTNIQLTLPKFSFQSSFTLSNALKDLGILDAFDSNKADFSGIDGTRNLSISEGFHQAFIEVDEEGTEATAATGVVAAPTSVAPTPSLQLTIDRPFIFMIQDKTTQSIVFMGQKVI